MAHIAGHASWCRRVRPLTALRGIPRPTSRWAVRANSLTVSAPLPVASMRHLRESDGRYGDGSKRFILGRGVEHNYTYKLFRCSLVFMGFWWTAIALWIRLKICLGASESEVNVLKNKSEIGMYLVHGTLQISDMEPYGTQNIWFWGGKASAQFTKLLP